LALATREGRPYALIFFSFPSIFSLVLGWEGRKKLGFWVEQKAAHTGKLLQARKRDGPGEERPGLLGSKAQIRLDPLFLTSFFSFYLTHIIVISSKYYFYNIKSKTKYNQKINSIKNKN